MSDLYAIAVATQDDGPPYVSYVIVPAGWLQ